MSEATNQSSTPAGQAPNTQPVKKKKTGKIAIALIVLILLSVIGYLVYFIYTEVLKDDTMPRVASTSGYVGEVAMEDLQAEADDTRYTTNMNVMWNFRSGDEESLDAYVGNLEINSRDVYIDVMLADNLDEVIYSSPIIPRGQALSKFKLDKVLPAGTYDAICTYHLIDENEDTVSELSIEVTINVLS